MHHLEARIGACEVLAHAHSHRVDVKRGQTARGCEPREQQLTVPASSKGAVHVCTVGPALRHQVIDRLVEEHRDVRPPRLACVDLVRELRAVQAVLLLA